MNNWKNNLINAVFIVAVFSFITMGVDALTANVVNKSMIYGALFIMTSIYQGGQDE